MALTRAFLKSLQLTEEQVSAIIEAHSETVEGLKAINTDLQSKLDEATPSAQKAQEMSDKYAAVTKEFEDFKAGVAAKDTRRAKESAYRELLRSAGVADKRFDTIVKYDSDLIDGLEIGEDGKVANADAINKAIQDNWSDFITQTKTVPTAPVPQPPANQPPAISVADLRGMSAADINARWDDVKTALKG